MEGDCTTTLLKPFLESHYKVAHLVVAPFSTITPFNAKSLERHVTDGISYACNVQYFAPCFRTIDFYCTWGRPIGNMAYQQALQCHSEECHLNELQLELHELERILLVSVGMSEECPLNELEPVVLELESFLLLSLCNVRDLLKNMIWGCLQMAQYI